jgi:Na+/H+-dicarboxylate symporter
MGTKTIIYYISTTAIAVATGLLLVNLIQPGKSPDPLRVSDQHISAQREASEVGSGGMISVLEKLVPTNLVQAASEGNMLGLIFFSIFLGVAILHAPATGRQALQSLLDTAFSALIWMVEKVMLLAPIGVFSLVASLVGGFVIGDAVSKLGMALLAYSGTVVAGLLFHGAVSLSLICFWFKISPRKLFRAMFGAVSTAFSTASSSATLPVTIECLEKRAGVSNRTASFVAPLGATINMDGTAIYEAVAAIFIANMYGIELGFGQQFTIFLTATFASVGAAGIPGAGLIMMTLVLTSVGLPVEGIELIVVVDRFLDMLRTSVNVWGDSVGSAVIARTEKEELSEIS